MRIGVYIYGLASVGAGILDLAWAEFDPVHQPIQAWSDHIPGVKIFACIAALWLIAGGAAMLWRSSERYGAAALTILYGIFVLFPLPRLYTAPHYAGYNAAVYIGVLSGVCQQIILFIGAAVAWKVATGALSQNVTLLARGIFGLCSIDFGLTHLTGIRSAVPFVPQWMPLGGVFWTVFTGVAFVLAGLAIIAGVMDVLAARLLGLMLLIFSALVLTPPIFASPHDHVPWGANAYNLTAVGAAWIVADWLATYRHSIQNRQSAKPAPA